MSTFRTIKVKRQVAKQKRDAIHQINKYKHLNKKY